MLSHFLIAVLFFFGVRAFKPPRQASRTWHSSLRAPLASSLSDSDVTREDEGEERGLRSAIEKAKEIAEAGQSPGAGLDAFESADAAYADLILTSSAQRKLDLDEGDIRALENGARMWEKGSKSRSSKKGGVIGDIINALTALSGGAHIVKDENGET